MDRTGTGNSLLFNLTIRSLRRNLGATLVLVAFILLAALLASTAATLLLSSSRAAAALMEQARTPHFLQMHAGELDKDRLERFAAQNQLVAEFELMLLLNVDGTQVQVGEGDLSAGLQDNSFVRQSSRFDYLLDLDGRVIEPQSGTVWLPLYYRELLGLQAGQVLTVQGSAADLHLEVAGFLRDSQMNSSYASSKRLLVAADDFERIAELTPGREYLIQFRLTDVKQVAEFEAAYRAAGLEANGPTITWSLFTLINSLSAGITAAVVILVTLLLVGIAILCVRFTLLTVISQEYREIGVLKALGVTTGQLQRMYGWRYLLLAAAAALAGFLLSPLLSTVLLRDIELFLGRTGPVWQGALIGLLLSALISAVVFLAVRRTVRRLDDVSPVQAIRSGRAVERDRRGASRPSLLRDQPGVNVRLGLRDVLNQPGLYAVPLVIFTLAAFIVVVPQNLHSTVTQPEFITYMGAGVSDLRIDVSGAAGDTAALEQALAADPALERFTVLRTAAYPLTTADGRQLSLKIEAGDHSAFPLSYLQGSAPTQPGEIALSSLQADDLGAAPGDRLHVMGMELSVSGIYQDVTNGGKTAKVSTPHESSELMWSTVYADLTPGTDIDEQVQRYRADWPGVKVSSVRDYVNTTLGGTADALQGAAWVALLIGLAVAALITALLMPMLLARDSSPVAIMRALGFRDSHIHLQYVTRALLMLVPGIISGAVLANVLGGGLAGLLLAPLGLSRLTLIANPLIAYFAAPALLLITVIITTILSTRPATRSSVAAALKD